MSRPLRDPSHAPLLALMQAGDVRALDQMARDFGPRLVAVALRCCRSPHDAEDAVQNAMVQASRSMTTFSGEGSPLGWMSTLVARSCFRMNSARTTDPLDEAACSHADPERALERRRLGEALSRALMILPRDERLLFMLAAEGFTGPEMAEQFGITPTAVRNRLTRTRQKLRRLLDDAVPEHLGAQEEQGALRCKES